MTDGEDHTGSGEHRGMNEEFDVMRFDVPWDNEFAADLADALFEVVVDHYPERFHESVVENPAGVKTTHISVTVTVEEDGKVQVIVPERYTA